MSANRETLKKDQIITLKGVNTGKTFTFQIRDEEVKEGSSCLVYRSLAPGNTPVILKELFPKCLAAATRNPDGTINWPRIKEGIKLRESQKRFTDSVNIMKVISNDIDYRRYIGADRNIEVLEGNNTLYCVNEDFGTTYIWSDIKNESIHDVLECSLAIAMFLDYLHQKGYVYVDLKPENIILPENGMQQIDYSNPKFIDFDSVLKNGVEYHMASVHGSPGYLPDYLPDNLADEILGFTNISYEGPDRYVKADPKFDVYSLAKVLEYKIKKEDLDDLPGDLKRRIVTLCDSMKKEDGCPSMKEVIVQLKDFIRKLEARERIREGNRFKKNAERYEKRYFFVMVVTILSYLSMTIVCLALGVQSKWVLSHTFARSRATVYLGATLCVLLILIVFTLKYTCFRLAINQEFSRIANQSYDSGLCTERNYFEYGYHLTVGKKRKDGGFYRPYLWVVLFIMIVAVFLVSARLSSIPLFFALGFASIIAFMYADYLPKDNCTFACAARRTYSGRFYSGIRIKGNERALYFLDEYDECNKKDIFEPENPFYKENHLSVDRFILKPDEEEEYIDNLDIQAIRNIYIMAWDTLINTKRIVHLVLLFITLLAVFLDIAAMSAFFTGYFHIPEIVFLPVTLIALVVNGAANIIAVYWDRAYAEEVVYFLFAARYYKEDVLRKQFRTDVKCLRILPVYIARGIQRYNEEIYVEGKYPIIRKYEDEEKKRFFSNRFLLQHLEIEEKRRIIIDIWLGFGILFSVLVWHMQILELFPVLLLTAVLLTYYMYHKGVSIILRRQMIRKIKKLKHRYRNYFFD